MNFPTTRVQPEQISAEALLKKMSPTNEEIDQMLRQRIYDETVYGSSWTLDGERIDPKSVYVDHVETPSAEDNDYAAPKLLIAFCCVVAAAVISLWYLF